MKRTLLPLALAIALLAPASAAAAPSATAKVTECASSLDAAERHLVVEGQIRRTQGARSLQMRFTLQVRAPSEPKWTTVRAPGFGVWHTADPAPRRYVYSKRVENLTAPASYRMVVRFRWRGAGRRTLASARRVTKVCEQPDLRPDLSPLKVTLAPGPEPGTRTYVVPVRNVGRTDAGPFSVTLWVNGRPMPSQAVIGLPAEGRTDLQLVAPRCEPGSSITIRVDPDGAVDERDEDDNQLARLCPANDS